MTSPKFEDALIARGYTPLICIGVGQRADGTYSVKLAASPVLRQLSPETWKVMKQTIIGAMERIVTEPMDDLEWE